MATPPQIKYVRDLAEVHDTTGLDALVADIENLSTKMASGLITVLKAAPPKNVAKVTSPHGLAEHMPHLYASTVTAPKLREEAKVGYYIQGERIFHVRWNKAQTHTYAEELIRAGGKASWRYQRGMGAELASMPPLSIKEAARLGKRWGICVVCGRHLSNPESVKAGIGPICAGKLS